MSDEFNPDSWDAIEGVLQPAQTPEVIGHDAAAAYLCRNYARGRLHHAWLLSGPRGIGKATIAFRFAEHLLRYPDAAAAPEKLEGGMDDSIHGQTVRGANPNILVVRRPFDYKAKRYKSQITAPEMRQDLLRFIGNTGSKSSWRIVIVDPADDLNIHSANALLKFLEEPPARTVFLIVAQTPRGLLPTIRSRCQVLPVKSLDALAMRKVLALQPLTANMVDEDIERLVRYSAGSPGRAMLLADSDVIEYFEAFKSAAEAGSPDYATLHKVAGGLSHPSKSREYKLFMDLAHDYVSERTRSSALEDRAGSDETVRWPLIWEKTRSAISRTEAYNLDRKQVVLDLFSDLRRPVTDFA